MKNQKVIVNGKSLKVGDEEYNLIHWNSVQLIKRSDPKYLLNYTVLEATFAVLFVAICLTLVLNSVVSSLNGVLYGIFGIIGLLTGRLVGMKIGRYEYQVVLRNQTSKEEIIVATKRNFKSANNLTKEIFESIKN